jgi:L-ascorbate metabolism protein UlaG (beta-lactamase superfamily)
MAERVIPEDIFAASTDPLPWPAGELVGGTLTWTGVAGLVFEVGGTRLALDPFVTRPGWTGILFRPAIADADAVRRAFPDLDAVLVGHAHFDHAMDLAPIAEGSPGVVIHGSATTVELGRRLGIPEQNLREVSDGDRLTFGPFTVTAMHSRHGVVPVFRHLDPGTLPARGLPRTAIRWPCGQVLSWRVEVGGRSFHLHSSAGIDDRTLARQEPTDVLVACLAARQGTPDYFGRLGRQLRPGLLIPFHHDDFTVPLDRPMRPVPRLDWPGFLTDVDALATTYGTRLHRLPIGVPVPI